MYSVTLGTRVHETALLGVTVDTSIATLIATGQPTREMTRTISLLPSLFLMASRQHISILELSGLRDGLTCSLNMWRADGVRQLRQDHQALENFWQAVDGHTDWEQGGRRSPSAKMPDCKQLACQESAMRSSTVQRSRREDGLQLIRSSHFPSAMQDEAAECSVRLLATSRIKSTTSSNVVSDHFSVFTATASSTGSRKGCCDDASVRGCLRAAGVQHVHDGIPSPGAPLSLLMLLGKSSWSRVH